jgi:methylenetetrahydrofolate dehydrogenase (NADP+)/methenyltetrahydrofolate cyclohydrolase
VRLIDGRTIAAGINAATTAQAAVLTSAGARPTLAVVVPTMDEATAWYVRSIVRAAAKVGVGCVVADLPDTTGPAISASLDELSADPAVHGVMCQTPLPDGLALHDVAGHIAPAKDVDGASPVSLGRLAVGLPTFAPATAEAVTEILHHEQIPLAGRRVVVVGRSAVVGKPAALLLLADHATVTICHSRSKDLAGLCREGEVIVAAAGRAHLLGAEHIAKGAVVIDVGTNPAPDGGLTGDVDAAAVGHLAEALTPVPGGVGPVTTAILLRHVVMAAAG